MSWRPNRLGSIWTEPIRNIGPNSSAPQTGDSKDEYWLVDGTLRLKSGNVGRNTPQASREMRDVPTRLKHMDELGVSIQVLYPTLFLIPLSPRPEVELALCRSYNRWLADSWKQAPERLRWAAVVPLMSMDQTLAEVRFAKENGACAIFMRGTEGDRLLSDPYFFPLYEEAQRVWTSPSASTPPTAARRCITIINTKASASRSSSSTASAAFTPW